MNIKHVIDVQSLTTDYIFSIFKTAQDIQDQEKNPLYKGFLIDKIIATVFYEPSTRTRLSFESAIHRLGGKIITVENAHESSSSTKGETLSDTIRTISSYADTIILRHPDDDSSLIASEVSSVPVINAGAGKAEHPTQALLDAYTIYQHFGKIDNLHVTMVGDLLRGRTIYSLVYILSKFPNNTFTFVSSKNFQMRDELRVFLQKNNISFEEKETLDDETLSKTNVLYATRIQKERCGDDKVCLASVSTSIIDETTLSKLNPHAVIMHPLPRVDEISQIVDNDPRAIYFKQVKNGVFVRMAILMGIIN
jgi:aspartate carbamoyltransferase catalytic subunit